MKVYSRTPIGIHTPLNMNIIDIVKGVFGGIKDLLTQREPIYNEERLTTCPLCKAKTKDLARHNFMAGIYKDPLHKKTGVV